MIETYPARVASLEPGLFGGLMESLQYGLGLGQSNLDVTKSCLQVWWS